MTYTLSYTAVSGLGLQRENNEDNLCVDGVYLGMEPSDDARRVFFKHSGSSEGSLLAAVFDGMGGEHAGDIAALTASKTLSGLPQNACADDVIKALNGVSDKLARLARAENVRCIGCTAAVLEISGSSAYIIGIGDSRVYRVKAKPVFGGSIEQLSHDQSEVQMLVDAGVITEKQARVHPMRHAITQYLGMPEGRLKARAETDIDISDGDIFLVCSDGLTECVDDQKICAMLRAGADASEVYDEAMSGGGVDNTTVIVIRVQKSA